MVECTAMRTPDSQDGNSYGTGKQVIHWCKNEAILSEMFS